MRFEVLPPNVSSATFGKVLADWSAIVGRDHVIHAADQLAPYRKIQIPIDEDLVAPSAVVMPDSVDQIREILSVANAERIPLWTISTGRNFGYGSAAPATRGQVVLDLRRMNRILDVDPDLCTALVEPGVSYGQLQAYIDENRLPLCLCMPSAGPIAGPTGNSLERGLGYTTYGDHWANVCGMEVMLADGMLVRTGMGGLSNQTSWQAFKYGFGPYLDGMFSQSNFGIVTKLGFWLMPKPEVTRNYRVSFPKRGDLGRVVETTRRLRLQNIVPGVCMLAHASVMVHGHGEFRRADVNPDGGRVSLEQIERFAKQHGIGVWNQSISFYGTEQQVRAAEEVALAEFSKIGGTSLQLPTSPDAVGRIGFGAYHAYNWVGGGGSIWFVPVAPTRGADAERQLALGEGILAEYGFDYTGAFIVLGRDMHHMIHLLYDRSDPSEMKKAHACFERLLKEFAAVGYGIYRVATAFMDQVAESYGPQLRDLNGRIKRALDPNGILAPGKSGIHS